LSAVVIQFYVLNEKTKKAASKEIDNLGVSNKALSVISLLAGQMLTFYGLYGLANLTNQVGKINIYNSFLLSVISP
jgi:hypothetical protein